MPDAEASLSIMQKSANTLGSKSRLCAQWQVRLPQVPKNVSQKEEIKVHSDFWMIQSFLQSIKTFELSY